MSNVSNIHQFAPLEKNSKALSGQRLVRLIAKKDKAGEYASANLAGSLCVSIPVIESDVVVDAIDRLIPHLTALVKDTQDKIIRDWRIQYGRNEIPEEVFGINAVVEYLDAAATGDKVSVEYLQEWFTEGYVGAAAQWIADAMNIDVTSDAVAHKVAVLRDMFAGWSSNRYSPNIPQLRAMIRFGESLPADAVDGRLVGYLQRATTMLTTKEEELKADALGF